MSHRVGDGGRGPARRDGTTSSGRWAGDNPASQQNDRHTRIEEAVSQGNLIIVEQAVEAFNAREVERFTSLTAPEFEWLPSMIAVEGHSFRGPDGVAAYFDLLAGAWHYFRVTPGRYLQGDGLVLLLGRLEGRGLTSGATVDSSLGMAFDIRDGSIMRIRGYLDHDEAVVAVGLAEQA